MIALISKPGLIDISANDYHADPCAVPSLSSTVAKKLINGTPRHAWHNHPRLNEFYDPAGDDEIKRSASMGFGSACHELMLGAGGGVHVLKALDKEGNPVTKVNTNEAKAEAKKAAEAGMVAVKQADYDRAKGVVEVAQRQLEWLDMDGESEVTGLAEFEKGVWCRFMADRLVGGRKIRDLKFSGVSAAVEDWPQQAARMNYHISAGHYRLTLAEILGIDVRHTEFLFVVVELGPPVLTIVHELPIGMSEIGLEQAEMARSKWAECITKGTDVKYWPGYGRRIHCGDDPGWLLAKHETKQAIAKLAFSPMTDDNELMIGG